ncbi:MAG: hypothetical protein L0Z70_14135, partial [Chloroflexi bacterium]|nr:hypothetical protein [Chloroflexota bacterium]
MSASLRSALRSLLLFALLLSACAPLVHAEQPLHARTVRLSAGASLGQTFTARYAGLMGVSVYLEPDQPGEGMLHYRLAASPEPAAPALAQGDLPLDQIRENGFQRLDFPPLPASTNADYYLSLAVEGAGRLRVGVAGGESYFQGALYQNGQPQNAQIAFRLAYHPLRLALGLMGELGLWLFWLAAGATLFVLPGWALLSVLGLRLPFFARLGVASGVSLAVYPLLLLWAHVLNLRLGIWAAWLPPLLGAVVLIRHFIHGRHVIASERSERSNLPVWAQGLLRRPDTLLMAAIVLLIAFSRFWAMRSLDAPLWGDSYQHTMIARLILDNGGLFASWRPYVPYETLTVQFGFPALAAAFAWFTGLDALRAVLVGGQ